MSGATIFADESAKAWSNYYGNFESPDGISRGNLLEDVAGQNLTRTSKAFDNWEADSGIGTQLKTHVADTPEKLVASIRRDLNDLNSKTNSFRSFRIDFKDGTSELLNRNQVNGRVLMIGVPWDSLKILTLPTFRQSMNNLVQGYQNLRVEIRIVPIPGWRR